MKRETLRTTITKEQLERLRTRQVTVRALAAELGVTESTLSRNFPGEKIGKVPPLAAEAKAHKRELTAARWDYRMEVAMRVSRGELNLKQGAVVACCTIRTMYRYLKRVEDEPFVSRSAQLAAKHAT